MRLIVLDRDGVINVGQADYIKNVDEWRVIPGSLEAIAQLHQAGFLVTVATNQSGIGKGLYTVDDLHQVHAKMQQDVLNAGGKIDSVFFCPHHPDDGCECRKPQPGLLHQIEKHYNVSLAGSCFVGDSWRDMIAAKAVNARGILVRTGHGETTLKKHPVPDDFPVYDDLLSFVTFLLTSHPVIPRLDRGIQGDA